MGALETVFFTAMTIVMAVLLFTAGFLFARFLAPGEGPARPPIYRRPQPKPAPNGEPAVPGVDVTKERIKIIARAKSEFGMSQAKAEQFAEDIIRQAGPLLGRLHQT